MFYKNLVYKVFSSINNLYTQSVFLPNELYSLMGYGAAHYHYQILSVPETEDCYFLIWNIQKEGNKKE